MTLELLDNSCKKAIDTDVFLDSPPGSIIPSTPDTSASVIGRKHRSVTSDDEKDEAYWERRKKNNQAAKKSRDNKRQREEQFRMRYEEMEKHTSTLETSVKELSGSVKDLAERNKYLERTLDTYKSVLKNHGFDN